MDNEKSKNLQKSTNVFSNKSSDQASDNSDKNNTTNTKQESRKPLDFHSYKVLSFSQLCGILTQNHQTQELDKLKKLYKSTSTIFLLGHLENESDAFSTDDESNCEEVENNEGVMSLWLSTTNKDNSEDNLIDLELANINELLENQKHPVKDCKAK
ncbi:7290_t:CDS:2 [Dentiscutata erythropus]|uniref:7290_t:CDS:1 n=1 Tax=Dentiscutata erythropus TaxID=1348616 RepID=A0A9N9HNM3_9GLOM|nr:7290_t:CDS:2 [Dentiscutata erythropus]